MGRYRAGAPLLRGTRMMDGKTESRVEQIESVEIRAKGYRLKKPVNLPTLGGVIS